MLEHKSAAETPISASLYGIVWQLVSIGVALSINSIYWPSHFHDSVAMRGYGRVGSTVSETLESANSANVINHLNQENELEKKNKILACKGHENSSITEIPVSWDEILCSGIIKGISCWL